MIKYIVVHSKDPNNVGDIASNPLQYFLPDDEYLTVDIADLGNVEYPAGVPIILGGGGLLGNEFFKATIQKVLASSDKNQLKELWNYRWVNSNPSNVELNKEFTEKYHSLISEYISKLEEDRAPRILWGAGHNGELSKKFRGRFEYPDWLSEFNLIGIRDWNQNLPWVPCASCMHPALRKKYEIKNDIIWFEHKKQMIKDFGKDCIPRFVNSGDNIEQTIELLGSANIILTNSYHGAYWGTLLKKKVIVVSPWSTKFQALKYPVEVIERTEQWSEVIDSVKVHITALDDCITTTQKYWEKVSNI